MHEPDGLVGVPLSHLYGDDLGTDGRLTLGAAFVLYPHGEGRVQGGRGRQHRLIIQAQGQ